MMLVAKTAEKISDLVTADPIKIGVMYANTNSATDTALAELGRTTVLNL